MITIEDAICTGCGQCIAVCPFTVLEMNADKQVRCNDKSCIACMHCAAICPQGAITFDGASAVSNAVTPLSEHTPEDCPTNNNAAAFLPQISKAFGSARTVTTGITDC